MISEKAHLLCLSDGDLQVLHSQRVFRADIDITALRSDRIGCDEHSFENEMGVSFKHAPIHEGAGVPFVRITDEILDVARGAAGETPFPSCRKPGSSPAPQSRFLNLIDHLLRRHGGENLAQGRITSAADVIPDLRRIDPAVVAEDLAHLSLIERNIVIVGDHPACRGIGVEQSLDEAFLKEGLRDNLRDIANRHLLIEDLLGKDDDDRSPFAETMAAGAHHIGFSLKALLSDLFDKGESYLLASPGPASCPAANGDTRLLRISST